MAIFDLFNKRNHEEQAIHDKLSDDNFELV